ncbi:MAG: putative flippase GtrA [Phenylobacterium sp.]|jgi:putative flippase GtrA
MLVLKYTGCAMIATLCNLLFQFISLELFNAGWFTTGFFSGFNSLYTAMFIGTLAGLVCKYALDKRFIFSYQSPNKKDDAKTFFLYSVMGIFTTLIFWLTEIAFDHLMSNPNAKYAGAVLGLGIGYVVKYLLDKKFVFVQTAMSKQETAMSQQPSAQKPGALS